MRIDVNKERKQDLYYNMPGWEYLAQAFEIAEKISLSCKSLTTTS